MRYWSNYYLHKWAKEADKANEQRKAEKSLKKSRKEYLISKYGYEYYLRDKLWERIKNQKKKETYYSWKQRLAIYGFTVQGFDTKRNEQHYGKPLVHEYVFGDNSDSKANQKRKEANTMNKLTWNEILQSFTQEPRDVITRKNGVWFYASGDGKNIFIESGKEHENRSKITVCRRLDKDNFDKVFDMYVNNEPRAKICEVTQNSSYWFGIFHELLKN